MLKLISILVFAVLPYCVNGQTMEQAKKLYYNGEIGEAQQLYKKILKKAPENDQTFYWFVLTSVQLGDLAAAYDAVQEGESKLLKSPWYSVAKGLQILHDKNVAIAKTYFEKAITSCNSNKKLKEEIVNAIGRAFIAIPVTVVSNPAYKPSKYEIIISPEDINYAIDKLHNSFNENKNNVETLILEASCLSIAGERKKAMELYEQATVIDNTSARAYYYLAKMYFAQGNFKLMLDNYKKAITADPSFAPAYLALYSYYDNINKPENGVEYFELYIKYTTASCNNDADYIRLLVKAQEYKKTLAKLKEIENSICKEKVNLNLLYALAFDKTGDSIQAKKYIDSYLAETEANKISAKTYLLAANIVKRFPDQLQKASGYYMQSIEKYDSIYDKVTAIYQCINMWEKVNNALEVANMYSLLLRVKENPSNIDVFKAGVAFYKINNYEKSASIFKTYSDKYTTDWRGPFWQARCASKLDSLMKTGDAAMYFEKYLALGAKDISNNKATIEAYYYLFAYTYNIKKDKVLAITYLDKILAIDPTNKMALQYKDQLK